MRDLAILALVLLLVWLYRPRVRPEVVEDDDGVQPVDPRLTGLVKAQPCHACAGRTYVSDGNIEDGMMTGRMTCPCCLGTGRERG